MPDSEDSTVTYTAVSSPVRGLSDIGSQGVPGPEEPEQAPPLPEFVPEPVYPEFIPPEDEDLVDYPTDGGDDDDDDDEEEPSGDEADDVKDDD
nr:hypothetical protein [Tanacetum cinerariifolium]